MNNAQKNNAFLALTDAKTREFIIKNIAKHYGISNLEVIDELTTDGAENLCDYVNGNERFAIFALMQKHGLN